MGVGIKVGEDIEEIGSWDFLFAFFSTISGNLETKWGSKFPILMRDLYDGEVGPEKATVALVELERARRELKPFPPQKLIWDIDDRSKTPPWGDKIASSITDLSNYFVTADGDDLFDVLRGALERVVATGYTARIVNC